MIWGTQILGSLQTMTDLTMTIMTIMTIKHQLVNRAGVLSSAAMRWFRFTGIFSHPALKGQAETCDVADVALICGRIYKYLQIFKLVVGGQHAA